MAPEAGRGAPRASDGSTLAVVPPIQTTVFVRLQVRSVFRKMGRRSGFGAAYRRRRMCSSSACRYDARARESM
jgi:hypothetical protein